MSKFNHTDEEIIKIVKKIRKGTYTGKRKEAVIVLDYIEDNDIQDNPIDPAFWVENYLETF